MDEQKVVRLALDLKKLIDVIGPYLEEMFATPTHAARVLSCFIDCGGLDERFLEKFKQLVETGQERHYSDREIGRILAGAMTIIMGLRVVTDLSQEEQEAIIGITPAGKGEGG